MGGIYGQTFITLLFWRSAQLNLFFSPKKLITNPRSEWRLRRTLLCFFQRKCFRQQFVGAVTRRGIVSPCDHDQLVEL